MEGKKYACTDVYVCIFFTADCREFLLTKREGEIPVRMKEIERTQDTMVYHGKCGFSLDAQSMYFEPDIIDYLNGTFCLSLYWDHDERNISNTHRQFAPKQGALTLSDTAFIGLKEESWLQEVDDEYLITDVHGNRQVYSSIELHCYELRDDV